MKKSEFIEYKYETIKQEEICDAICFLMNKSINKIKTLRLAHSETY